jgi:hypothetical protein
MKFIILITLIVSVLAGCEKSAQLGYDSYNQCMVEITREQQNTNSSLQYATTYCLELFPNQFSLKESSIIPATNTTLEEGSTESISPEDSDKIIADEIREGGLSNASNNNLVKLLGILEKREQTEPENLQAITEELNEVIAIIEIRIAEGQWNSDVDNSGVPSTTEEMEETEQQGQGYPCQLTVIGVDLC